VLPNPPPKPIELDGCVIALSKQLVVEACIVLPNGAAGVVPNVVTVLKPEELLFPKGCAEAAGVEPNPLPNDCC